MKKYYILLMSVAALSFATLSCSKEVIDPSQQEPNQKEEPVKEEPDKDDTPVPEGMIRLTFNVSQEGDASDNKGDDTKTTWDGANHAWSTGDKIRIIVGEGNVEGTDYVEAEVVDGKVTANVPDADYYYAVYPTTATYTFTAAEGKITITIPRYQKGTFSEANIMAAKTSKAAAKLNFKNMTSIVKLTTGNKFSYNTIAVMANDQTKLTGTVSTTFEEPFKVETTNGSDAILSLQKGNPSGYAGVSANTTYYLAMLPGAEVAQGIGFKIEQRDSETDLIAGGISKSAFARERAKVYDLGTLDDRIVTDWYISESGTGVGNVESAPASPARLMDLLNPSYSTNNTTAGWRLVGATIHVLPGTYNLQELNGGEVFDPHYNLSNLKVHVKGEGTAVNPTKFICNQSADDEHIFAVTGSHKVGDFTFENITFTANPSASNTNSSGIAFNYTSTDDGNNTITFKNCVFEGLTSTASSDTFGGAAVMVYTNKKFMASFVGCKFHNNTAVRGGAVALCNTDAESKVVFSDCEFKTNVATKIGGCAYLYENGQASFSNTTFTGSDDGETVNALHGGALGIVAGASVSLENGCIFSKLTSSQNGGAVFNHGNFNATDVTFTSCKSKNSSYNASAGTIFTDGTTNIVNATFSNNTSNTGSAILASGSDGKIGLTTIFNSLFDSNETTATDGSGSSQKGCTVFALQYCDVLLANCTLRNNIEHNASHGVVSPRNNTAHISLVSCTLSDNLVSDGSSTTPGKDIARTTGLISAHNTIATNTPASILNVVREYSIFSLRRFAADKDHYEDMGAFTLGSYNDGVYRLNNSYSTAYNAGMSADDLKAITYTNITLTDDQKALLAKDQKGNPRTGTIMGAYVLTE